MRISELATASGVPLPTVKFYLRTGLLPPGRRTSATQAVYDDAHVARLRLVRALAEVGGLSLAAVRRIVEVLDGAGLHDALGVATSALPPTVGDDVDVATAHALLDRLGWRVRGEPVALRQFAVAVRAAEAAGLPVTDERLRVYGTAAADVAAADIAGVPTSSVEDAVVYSVVGTVLYEPILLALRRLAHEDASVRRFADARASGTVDGAAAPPG